MFCKSAKGRQYLQDQLYNLRSLASPDSLGWADVKLHHAKGKIVENTVCACALLSALTDTHGTKGEKGTISRMSDQANDSAC